MPSDPHALVAPYALDALDEDEARAYEEHLAACERCREELAGLREAAAGLAYAAAGPAPPPELRGRILEGARAERPNVVSLPQRPSWTAPLAAAAALAAAVAIGVGVWGATRPEGGNAFTAVLAEPGAKVVPMGEGGALAVAPDGSAAIAVSARTAPAGKTYEAWVIEDGTPRRAGLFEGGEGTSVVELDRPARRGAVVAVTLERDGGVDRPTQEPLMSGRVA